MRADCPATSRSTAVDVSYDVENVLDQVPSTAWLCDGSATGRCAVLEFATPVTITSVALLPGYDKKGADGYDRFDLHRTVTGVRWQVGGARAFSR